VDTFPLDFEAIAMAQQADPAMMLFADVLLSDSLKIMLGGEDISTTVVIVSLMRRG
jgi:hypothetical protein